MCGNSDAVDEHDLDRRSCRPAAAAQRPVLDLSSRKLCNSFSEMLKFTHIGESTATVVSWLFGGLM